MPAGWWYNHDIKHHDKFDHRAHHDDLHRRAYEHVYVHHDGGPDDEHLDYHYPAPADHDDEHDGPHRRDSTTYVYGPDNVIYRRDHYQHVVHHQHDDPAAQPAGNR